MVTGFAFYDYKGGLMGSNRGSNPGLMDFAGPNGAGKTTLATTLSGLAYSRLIPKRWFAGVSMLAGVISRKFTGNWLMNGEYTIIQGLSQFC